MRLRTRSWIQRLVSGSSIAQSFRTLSFGSLRRTVLPPRSRANPEFRAALPGVKLEKMSAQLRFEDVGEGQNGGVGGDARRRPWRRQRLEECQKLVRVGAVWLERKICQDAEHRVQNQPEAPDRHPGRGRLSVLWEGPVHPAHDAIEIPEEPDAGR